MKTYLPYPKFSDALGCLDDETLLAQRNDARTVYNAIERGRTSGYHDHPLVERWRSYKNALALYHNFTLFIWLERGYYAKASDFLDVEFPIEYPEWIGNDSIHQESRKDLMKLKPTYYKQFNWKV